MESRLPAPDEACRLDRWVNQLLSTEIEASISMVSNPSPAIKRSFASLQSRETIKRWIKKGQILVNGKPAKPALMIGSSDTIDIQGILSEVEAVFEEAKTIKS